MRTPSDFGTRGEPPTHPELLDYLARRFMADGWSIKKLHRLLMLSSVYQQQSQDNPLCREKDPKNLLWWKMNRRWLDWESLRDALLSVSGQLDLTLGGTSVNLFTQPFSKRRTVYGFIDRQNLLSLFRTFDIASPDSSAPQRHETTVPQQALFMMNSPFLKEQAQRLAERPDLKPNSQKSERINAIHLLLFGRPARAEEITLGTKYLESSDSSTGPLPAGASPMFTAWEEYAQALLLANEFMFVD